MRFTDLLAVSASTLLSLETPLASATLLDRGGGLLYDTTLDVTWLSDANYARTSGFDPTDGQMSFAAAADWVSHLSYLHTPSGQIITGWRLPKVTPQNGASFNYTFQYDGMSDNGFNISATSSELGYMFFVNLGLPAEYDKNGAPQHPYGVPAPYTQEANVGPVHNLKNIAYWTQTYYAGPENGYDMWVFSMNRGSQDPYGKGYGLVPWPVIDGDVAAVPEPSVFALLLAGGCIVVTRKLVGARRSPRI